MEMMDYFFIPLSIRVVKDDVITSNWINHAGLCSIGWKDAGIQGSWCDCDITTVKVNLSDGSHALFFLTESNEFKRIIIVGGLDKKDIEFVAKCIYSVIPDTMPFLVDELSNGFKFDMDRNTKILMKASKNGIEFKFNR